MVHDPRNYTNGHEIAPRMPLFVVIPCALFVCNFVDCLVSSGISMLVEL
jgi:hypothetical protein